MFSLKRRIKHIRLWEIGLEFGFHLNHSQHHIKGDDFKQCIHLLNSLGNSIMVNVFHRIIVNIKADNTHKMIKIPLADNSCLTHTQRCMI